MQTKTKDGVVICPKCDEPWLYLPADGKFGCPGCNPEGYNAPKDR